MASRSSSLRNAFVWAVSMAAVFGIGESLIGHEKRGSGQIKNEMGIAAISAAVVGYNERRRSPS
jgi:hypothetical protein